MARHVRSRSRSSPRTAYRNPIHNYCQYLLGGAIAQYRETLRLKPSYTPAQEMLNEALARGGG